MKLLKISGIIFVLLGLLLTLPLEGSSWERNFGGNFDQRGLSVQQTTDGGYIITGKTYPSNDYDYSQVYLVKTNANGNEVWSKTFGGGYADSGESVQQTTDGGYIIVGTTSPVYYAQIFLIKTDTNGNEVWSKTFGGSKMAHGYSVQQTTDGGYIIAGITSSVGDVYLYLIKTDAYGTQLWDRTFVGTFFGIGVSVQQTPDGGYIIAGTIEISDGNTDVYLIKTDRNGNKLWDNHFGGIYNDYGNSVQQTTDGGYIIAGTSITATREHMYLIKTDHNGNEEWSNTFPKGHIAVNGRSAKQTTDGGYIIVGRLFTIWRVGDEDISDWQAHLIKTDPNGNELWNKLFGEKIGYDSGQSIQKTTDGGYIIVGVTSSYGADELDVYLIKTDANGNSRLWVAFDFEGTEEGTYDAPYKTLAGAVDVVELGGNITIKPGTSAETGTFSKNFILQAYGGDVIIGQ